MRYIKKKGEDFISKNKMKDFMFKEVKPKIQRPPAEYSNPQWHLLYGYNGPDYFFDNVNLNKTTIG